MIERKRRAVSMAVSRLETAKHLEHFRRFDRGDRSSTEGGLGEAE
jgi:hypothetical protein